MQVRNVLQLADRALSPVWVRLLVIAVNIVQQSNVFRVLDGWTTTARSREQVVLVVIVVLPIGEDGRPRGECESWCEKGLG